MSANSNGLTPDLKPVNFFIRPSNFDQMRDPLQESWNQSFPDTHGKRQGAGRTLSGADLSDFVSQIDFGQMNGFFDRFMQVLGLPVAIIDLDGKVLASSRWQRLCHEFHRANSASLQRCRASDIDLSGLMGEGKSHAIHRCRNGLTDCATPIMVDGRHVANLFTGQFLLLEPEMDFFRSQQETFGFSAKEYFEALAEIPILDEFKLPAILEMLSSLAELIARQSLAQKRAQTAHAMIQHEVDAQIEELTASHALLHKNETKYRGLFDLSPVGIAINDFSSGQFIEFNQALLDSVGYSEKEFLELSYWDLTPREYELEEQQQLESLQLLGRYGPYEKEYIHRDGHRVPVLLHGRMMDGSRIYSVVQDISERKQAEIKIQELAFFDQLTGLPNRTLLMDRLKQAMIAGTRSGSYGALLLIDLDNFKTLNDTHGHDMGDLLLKQVAERLIECVRAEDTVARLGGDEFVVMLLNLTPLKENALATVKTIGEKIRLALSRVYQLKGESCLSTPSIGATLFRGQLDPIDDLLKQADLAMYQSKDAGRNAIRFFDPAMQTAVAARSELEARLRKGLEEKQFLLHYQAQVAGDGCVSGAEVLLRWMDPERGMVSPADFIPIAESTGLILPLGHWVLETACQQLALWTQSSVMAGFTIAVNVSSRQFRQPDFVEQVIAVLAKTGANPALLKLELTESLMVENVQDIIEKMLALKAKGVGFSLDDFGTGYSSLSYLKRMPLDQLKIDQSFVRDVLSDPNDAAIARTVVALGQSLGLAVIAEGVETEEQRVFLAAAGCDAYQGYFFSRPLPIADFEKFALRG